MVKLLVIPDTVYEIVSVGRGQFSIPKRVRYNVIVPDNRKMFTQTGTVLASFDDVEVARRYAESVLTHEFGGNGA